MDFYRFRLPGFEHAYTRSPRNRAYVAVLQVKRKSPGDLEEQTREIHELIRSASIKVLAGTRAFLPHPSPSHFVRQGKLTQIRDEAAKAGADILIFNVDLSPNQAGNIEAFTKIPVIDRTGLILEIFGRRAKSREGQLQVELAQLEYVLPRLGGLGTVMSRLGGGIGSRGPGEQELERDRRKVRRRILQVQSKLQDVRRHRELIRAGRKKKNFKTVAIVGYTNGGKSTLLNALTGAGTLVEDKMFATLDPKARMESVNGRRNLLFVDTVGFLRDLPHALIKSFHATLEEVAEADLLIHVLDAADTHTMDFHRAVENVLRELNAAEKPRVLALNKADLLDDTQKKRVQELFPEGILISSKDRLGLNHLLFQLEKMMKSTNPYQPLT